MSDYIIRATAYNNKILAFAVLSTETVERARNIHSLTPTCCAALGRSITAASMMGMMMKGKEDTLTLTIKGDGPIGKIVVVANNKGKVKGYVENPGVDLPLNKNGKLDVGGAVGKNGFVTVIKDIGLKEPYIGQVEIQTGEIAEDITYYFTVSEQVPSAVGLGVLVGTNGQVLASGGFIIQLMPDVDDAAIEKIEAVIKNMPYTTDLIKDGYLPEDILKYILKDFDLCITEKMDLKFECDCSKERFERAIISLGEEEIQRFIEEKEPVEIICHFCGKKYLIYEDELRELLSIIKR